jgi:hypothetical protein
MTRSVFASALSTAARSTGKLNSRMAINPNVSATASASVNIIGGSLYPR